MPLSKAKNRQRMRRVRSVQPKSFVSQVARSEDVTLSISVQPNPRIEQVAQGGVMSLPAWYYGMCSGKKCRVMRFGKWEEHVA